MHCCPTLKITGIVCVLVFVLTACQKELSGDSAAPGGCQLTKVTYYDSSMSVDDSAGLVYSNNQINRVNAKDYYFTFRYTSSRVSRINYFDNTNTYLDVFDSVTYNSSGKIQSVIFYSTTSGVDYPVGGYLLTYNSDGTIGKVIEEGSSGTPGSLADAYEYDYTWLQGNITKVTITDLSTSLQFPLIYTYDATSSYYKKYPAEFIFADTYMFGITGYQFG